MPASERQNKTWGLPGRRKPAGQADVVDVDRSPEADLFRAKCVRDLKFFYYEVLAKRLKNRRTGVEERQTLSRIHDFLIDFLVLEDLAERVKADPACDHSGLVKLLPERENGEFKERWLYWPTLQGPAMIQDGPTGPVSEMFYGRFWQGLVIRLVGDGMTKCILFPRGFLKSTLCSQAYPLWKLVDDPSLRFLIRTGESRLAVDDAGQMETVVSQNPVFRRYWGDLGPPQRQEKLPWNQNMFSLRCKVRRGVEPTVRAGAIDSGLTGGHYDAGILDDAVGARNYGTPKKCEATRKKVEEMPALLDPGALFMDVGTPWEDNDVHWMFTGKDGALQPETSFCVATLLDADETVPVSTRIAKLGYGKSQFPEKFTPRAVQRIRHGIRTDRFYFGQYFCQMRGTAARTFDTGWLEWYEGDAPEIARAKQLNVFMWLDTASGKPKQTRDLDYSALWVFGQTPDREHLYWLGGFNERVPAEKIAPAFIDVALYWRKVVAGYGGVCKAGVEETAYTNFLQVLLDVELKRRGVDAVFGIETMKWSTVAKHDRICQLSQPYFERRVFWPRVLMVPSLVGAEAYDLVATGQEQYERYGPAGIPFDDLLDAQAGSYALCYPLNWKTEDEKPEKAKLPGAYSREDAANQARRGPSGPERYRKAHDPLQRYRR